MTTSVRPGLPGAAHGLAAGRFAATNAAAERFFGQHADAIALACRAMAERFQRGGRLLVCGEGAQRSDVAHVVVEFLHPVVVGKRALPAMALPEPGTRRGEQALATLGRAGDILLTLTARTLDARTRALVVGAQTRGLLTVVLCAEGGSGTEGADHLFAVPSTDPCIVQETHEMLYHVLWELVHVFFDHRTVSA